VRRQNRLVPRVDQIADRLADEVVADGQALHAVLGQQCAFVNHVGLGGKRLLHVEMVAPARQLQAVIAHAFGQRRELGQRQVGPLAGEEGDGSWHRYLYQGITPSPACGRGLG
jgi:hypothetical protein